MNRSAGVSCLCGFLFDIHIPLIKSLIILSIRDLRQSEIYAAGIVKDLFASKQVVGDSLGLSRKEPHQRNFALIPHIE